MGTAAAEQVPISAAQRMLRLAVFVCGVSSAFGIDLLGQLYWAELLLPLLAVAAMMADPPRELLASRAFRILMWGVVLMFVGYVLSDLAAGTSRENYLRGWARVAALGSNTFSLCVLCSQDARRIWWYCCGMATGTIIANIAGGMPLSVWKLGYAEPVAYFTVSAGAVTPLSLAAGLAIAMGVLNILLDYRSMGVFLMLVGLLTFLWARGFNLRKIWKTLPVVALGLVVVAIAAIHLLNASAGEHSVRRAASNIARFAALRVGAQAIVDSPFVGYGSWGEGTEQYANMLYDDTLDAMLDAGAQDMLGRGRYFSAHSQLIQAWMEGGLLAAFFFLVYMVILMRSIYFQLKIRAPDYLTPLVLLITGTALWNSLMSPFLGPHRMSIALAAATAIALSIQRRPATRDAGAPAALGPVRMRPVNLMP